MAEARARFDEVRDKRIAWAKAHCKPTVKHQTTISDTGFRRSGLPEGAWICDGKPVEYLKSHEEGDVDHEIATIQMYLWKCCDQKVGVGGWEKICYGEE